MIDLSKSDSWHLKILKFTDNFVGWYDDANDLSHLGRLTTCSYFWLVLKSLVFLAVLSALCLVVVSSSTIHLVLTGMLYTGDFISAFNEANNVLYQHFGEQFGAVGGTYIFIGDFALFSIFVIVAVLIMGLATFVLNLLATFVLNPLFSGIKQKDFKQITLKKQFKNSSTYKILHSVLNKYCVPVKIHHD